MDESAFVGEDDGLGTVVEVELGEDACDVGFDGGVADDELVGDVAVGHAAGDQAQDLELAWCQLAEGVGVR